MTRRVQQQLSDREKRGMFSLLWEMAKVHLARIEESFSAQRYFSVLREVPTK